MIGNHLAKMFRYIIIGKENLFFLYVRTLCSSDFWCLFRILTYTSSKSFCHPESPLMLRFLSILIVLLTATLGFNCSSNSTTPQKIAVLTFDDAVQSHRDVVAPLLSELGFGATFFVTHKWMADTANFMSWEDIAQLHEMGFEIGNHTWTHADFAIPKNAARLAGELGLVDLELHYRGVPKPISFAYTGNFFGPKTWQVLKENGIRFARRGMQPEQPYGEIHPGPLYDPLVHHPLLIPTAGDAYPDWNFAHFKQVVDRAEKGKYVVLQFHGVPDIAHGHVHTPPDSFRLYMNYLKDQGFRVIALRDLESVLPDTLPDDPMLSYRYTRHPTPDQQLPPEMIASRQNLSFWLENMLIHHAFSLEETAAVLGYSTLAVQHMADSLGLPSTSPQIAPNNTDSPIKILPYPGGRHPRIGFLDGAINPMRGTKASIFLPWDTTQYVVVDIPEAIFSQLGLTFLAHTHLPTIWDHENQLITNYDWKREDSGTLSSRWTLPNGIVFGARLIPKEQEVNMEMWIENGSDIVLDSLITQVCMMFKGASDFDGQLQKNKRLGTSVTATKSEDDQHWILTSWEGSYRAWDNPDVPCMHVDPQFAMCPPGDRVSLRGKIWFYSGNDIETEMAAGESIFR